MPHPGESIRGLPFRKYSKVKTRKPDLAGSKENLPGQNQSQNQVAAKKTARWFRGFSFLKKN
jgi:hypothetical protein